MFAKVRYFATFDYFFSAIAWESRKRICSAVLESSSWHKGCNYLQPSSDVNLEHSQASTARTLAY